jgi:hypothetical protein
MFAVMNRHRHGVDVRLQRFGRIGQLRQFQSDAGGKGGVR